MSWYQIEEKRREITVHALSQLSKISKEKERSKRMKIRNKKKLLSLTNFRIVNGRLINHNKLI